MTPAATASGAESPALRAQELVEEQDHFLALVAELPAADWTRSTPAVGWTIHDQVAHIVLVEELAASAVTDPDAFARTASAAAADSLRFESDLARLGRSRTSVDLLDRWAVARDLLGAGIRTTTPDRRIAWFGPPMRPMSFLAARLMETWAHGQDIRDALGIAAPVTGRLRAVADLGVRTRSWSYLVRGLEPNREPLSVRLEGPTGTVWTWGEGPLGVSGTALDFCAVVTQRRHWSATELRARTSAAAEWLEIAQAFAGPPTLTAPDRTVRDHD